MSVNGGAIGIFSGLGVNAVLNRLSTGETDQILCGLQLLSIGGIFTYLTKRSSDLLLQQSKVGTRLKEFLKSRPHNQ